MGPKTAQSQSLVPLASLGSARMLVLLREAPMSSVFRSLVSLVPVLAQGELSEVGLTFVHVRV